MDDAVIIGGGPVGLLMAILLRLQGRTVTVLERRETASPHSRAIGIHPPALAVLEAAGVADDLISSGVRIVCGRAFSGGRMVAELDFTRTSEAFPFILSVPQNRTEAVLEARLRGLAPGAVRRGRNVIGLEDQGDGVRIQFESGTPVHRQEQCLARIAVVADGAHSRFRADIDGTPRITRYPDYYLMGDFRDETPFGDEAILFLESAGIVECFPLPGKVRRWVVRLGSPCEDARPAILADLIRQRTRHVVDTSSNSMVSAFGVTSSLASRLVHDRVVLAGDAAHVISPIGGQGMNLGWLDAAALAPALGLLLDGGPYSAELAAVERSRHRAARRAIRQAGLNMALGRPLPPVILAARNRAFAWIIAIPAARNLVAKRFTMH